MLYFCNDQIWIRESKEVIGPGFLSAVGEDASKRSDHSEPNGDHRAQNHPHGVSPAEGEDIISVLVYLVPDESNKDDIDEEGNGCE